MTDVQADLNEEQRRAVAHGHGPLLISAGPGSGKTRVIAHRIARRISSGDVAPERLLAITFTNRAAREMESRVRLLVGDVPLLRIGTFHWACHAILRRYGTGTRTRSFRLLSPSEARIVLRGATGTLAGADRSRLPAAVSAVKNGAELDTIARRYRLDPAVLREARHAYDRRLQELDALDLDDLVLETAQLLARDGEIRERCRSAYDEILIDEFQDTNPVQLTVVELLAPVTNTVVAVGDADQAIYGWRQADSQGTLRFLDSFPQAAVIRLDRSYRSSKRILRAASSLIAHNSGRLGGELRTTNPAGERPVCYAADDERDEAEWVAAEIEHLRDQGVEPDEVAVLYRLNAQSRAIEEALLRHGVPYQVVGARRFFERSVVQRAIAYLRLSAQNDESAAALLAQAVHGIGPRRLEQLRNRASSRGISLIEAMASAGPGVSRAATERLADVSAAVMTFRTLRVGSLMDLVDAVIDRVAAELEADGEIEQEAAAEDLGELRSLVVEMGARATLPALLDRVALGASEGAKKGVSLMTLHAAKGTEFGSVFITGVEEGLLPHQRSLDRNADIEEERRLCYVGMTRAMDRLYLSYAHTRLLAGRSSIGHPSRFIGEVTPELITVKVSAKRRARPRLAFASVGDAVAHPRWRNGIVRQVEGSGRDTLVTVEFESGTRRLQLCHAPLTRLDTRSADVPAS